MRLHGYCLGLFARVITQTLSSNYGVIFHWILRDRLFSTEDRFTLEATCMYVVKFCCQVDTEHFRALYTHHCC